jgi:hypothetical protein
MLAQNTIHQKSRWKKGKKLLIFVEVFQENQTPIGLLWSGYEYKSATQHVVCILIPQLLRFWKIKSDIIHVDILK